MSGNASYGMPVRTPSTICTHLHLVTIEQNQSMSMFLGSGRKSENSKQNPHGHKENIVNFFKDPGQGLWNSEAAMLPTAPPSNK